VNDAANILVLGLGSEILKDDGIGPKLIKDLKAHFTNKDFTFKTSHLGGLEILELIKGFQVAIIIDGIKTYNGDVGEVYFMNSDKFIDTLHISSRHDVSFSNALKLAAELSQPVPEEIYIIAIEINEDTEFGDELSEAIQEKYVNILNSIHQYILQLYNRLLEKQEVN
jgi:hydrogenase maturation protease